MATEYVVEPVTWKGHWKVRIQIVFWELDADVFYIGNEFEQETIGL